MSDTDPRRRPAPGTSRRVPSGPRRGRPRSARPDQRPDLPDRDLRLGRRRRARARGRGRRAGLRLQPDLQPDDAARSATPMPSWPAAAAGTALASGMGAIHATIASLVQAGDRIVAPLALYGSTRAAARPGVRRLRRPGGHRRHDRPRRGGRRPRRRPDAGPLRRDDRQPDDVPWPTTPALAELAHRHGATYVVDNTFASPYVCRPLDLGRRPRRRIGDQVPGRPQRRHRRRGRRDRRSSSPASSGVQIDTGATLGPLEAFLVLRGILTLAIRIERHAATAAALAAWLDGHAGRPRASSIPVSPSHPQHDVALRQFRPGVAGGMLAFEVAGGRDAGRAVIDALRLPERPPRSAASTRWSSIRRRPRTGSRPRPSCSAAGITPGLLRVSVGLEDLEDLQADLDAALEHAGRSVPALGAV